MSTSWMILVCIGGFAYLFLVGMGIFGLIRLVFARSESSKTVKESVSVIIAARNEEDNIANTLKSLLAQDYPPELLEIIVVDDRSEDRTGEIVSSFNKNHPHINLIHQRTCVSGLSPKKQALEIGIRASHGDILVVTDADCYHEENWITALLQNLTTDVGMVVGQARFILTDSSPLWQRMQALDFQAQSILSAGLISAGMPFTCSGASLAYRRKLFNDVNGWDGVKHLISGDDELLMAKAHRSGWKVVAAKRQSVVVETLPVKTLRELWHQRIRWGSKGLHYHWSRMIVLMGVFLFYLMLAIGPIISVFGGEWFLLIRLFGLKFILDCIVLALGKKLFDDGIPKWELILLEFFHPLLIVILAVGGSFTRFEWKGESFKQ